VTATDLMTLERPDLIRWVSTDRIVDGRPEPEELAFTLVKAPSPPGASPEVSKTTTETPEPSRSPR
jgi:hypothetical protein